MVICGCRQILRSERNLDSYDTWKRLENGISPLLYSDESRKDRRGTDMEQRGN